MFQKGKKNPHSGGLNIMIVGCGKVGMTLVDRLSKEGHDISVVDKNAARLQSVTHMHDVYGVVGNGASFTVLKEAGIENTDILISVTDSDELNLLCCLVAKRSGHWSFRLWQQSNRFRLRRLSFWRLFGWVRHRFRYLFRLLWCCRCFISAWYPELMQETKKCSKWQSFSMFRRSQKRYISTFLPRFRMCARRYAFRSAYAGKPAWPPSLSEYRAARSANSCIFRKPIL